MVTGSSRTSHGMECILRDFMGRYRKRFQHGFIKTNAGNNFCAIHSSVVKLVDFLVSVRVSEDLCCEVKWRCQLGIGVQI